MTERDYINGILEENRGRLESIFISEKDRYMFSENYLEEIIFNKTKKTIEDIAEYFPWFGMITYSRFLVDEFKFPELILGWIKEEKLCDGPERNIFNYNTNPLKIKGHYSLKPTEEGFKVLDGLRELRRQFPIREANKFAVKSLFDMAKGDF